MKPSHAHCDETPITIQSLAKADLRGLRLRHIQRSRERSCQMAFEATA